MPTCAHFAETTLAVAPPLAAGSATGRACFRASTVAAPPRRFRDEFGGNISELERDLIRQAAGLTLRAEQLQGTIVRGEPISNDELVRISSTAKRLPETIRAKADKRKPAGPTLQEYLAQRAQKAAEAG